MGRIWLIPGIVVTSGLLRFLFGVPFVPEVMAQALFGILPMSLFQFFLNIFGGAAKWIAFAICVAVYCYGLVWLCVAFVRHELHRVAVFLVTTTLVGGVVGLLSVRELAYSTSGYFASTPYAVGLVTAGFVHALGLVSLRGLPGWLDNRKSNHNSRSKTI